MPQNSTDLIDYIKELGVCVLECKEQNAAEQYAANIKNKIKVFTKDYFLWSTDADGQTALMHAVRLGNYIAVNLICDKSVEGIDDMDEFGDSALVHAVRFMDMSTIADDKNKKEKFASFYLSSTVERRRFILKKIWQHARNKNAEHEQMQVVALNATQQENLHYLKTYCDTEEYAAKFILALAPEAIQAGEEFVQFWLAALERTRDSPRQISQMLKHEFVGDILRQALIDNVRPVKSVFKFIWKLEARASELPEISFEMQALRFALDANNVIWLDEIIRIINNYKRHYYCDPLARRDGYKAVVNLITRDLRDIQVLKLLNLFPTDSSVCVTLLNRFIMLTTRGNAKITSKVLKKVLSVEEEYPERLRKALLNPRLISAVFQTNTAVLDQFMMQLPDHYEVNMQDDSSEEYSDEAVDEEDSDSSLSAQKNTHTRKEQPMITVGARVFYLQQALQMETPQPDLMLHWIQGMCQYQKKKDYPFSGVNEVVNLLCENGRIDLVKAALPLALELIMDPYLYITCEPKEPRVQQLLAVIKYTHRPLEGDKMLHLRQILNGMLDQDLRFIKALYTKRIRTKFSASVVDEVEQAMEKRLENTAIATHAVPGGLPVTSLNPGTPPPSYDAIKQDKKDQPSPSHMTYTLFSPKKLLSNTDATYESCMQTLKETFTTLEKLTEVNPALAKKIRKAVRAMTVIMRVPKQGEGEFDFARVREKP